MQEKCKELYARPNAFSKRHPNWKPVAAGLHETVLKNKSYFKKSMGDEAGCAAKKGVLTTKNRGKVYFTMWSMDVKFEGKNVVRHFDLTTHNHMSMPGNSPP